MKSLKSFQLDVCIALLVVAWVHVPALGITGYLSGRDTTAALAVAVVFAVLPTILFLLRRPILATSLAIGVAFVAHASLFVFLLRDNPWQVEAHFYYFALLAMLSGLCEWRVILTAAVLIAVHHFGLDALLPSAIYPGGSDFSRALFHAAVVVIESAMLIGIAVQMKRTFNAAYAATSDMTRVAAELREVAAGREKDLLSSARRNEELQLLVSSFEREIAASIGALHQAAEALEESARGLGVTAESASSQSMKVAAITEETSTQVKTVASAGEVLAQTIAEVGNSVSQSSRLANEAVSQAMATTHAIDEMAQVAAEIGNVTSLISAIAAQTNLLALNATIEAARAGDAGRGFAVVAQEVKALAAQTAQATQDIATRIEAMQHATSKSVSAIERISSVITELDRFSARIADSVEEQVASARDIAGNVSSVAEGVGEVAASIGQIEAVAERANRAAAQLNLSAASVTGQTSRIRERMRSFADEVEKIRA